jgi:hypothetical protein
MVRLIGAIHQEVASRGGAVGTSNPVPGIRLAVPAFGRIVIAMFATRFAPPAGVLLRRLSFACARRADR